MLNDLEGVIFSLGSSRWLRDKSEIVDDDGMSLPSISLPTEVARS